jgi:SAM-dependent methyltransferase
MTSDNDGVKATLLDMEVHDGWTAGYRTVENEAFYSLAFDHVAQVLGAPNGEPILDAGCGSGTKSAHLAMRGFQVVGVDISERILETGRANLDNSGLSDRVTLQLADLTAMSFNDGAFRGVLCWGVLMHVPEVEKAIAELARVTRPGGTIVISEGNRYSIQAVGLRWLKRLLNRERAEVRARPSGVELWEETSAGRLVTRQSDIKWLIGEFGRHGAQLIERRSGQFTEVFTLIPWKPVRTAVHAFNNGWFRWPRFAGPAFGNLLVFRKTGQ